MSAILIRSARLVCPASGRDGVADLAVADRRIAAIGADLPAPAAASVVDGRGLVLCPGLTDSGVFATDLAAAAAGGITCALLMPDQAPVLDEPALIERAERLGKPTLWVRPLAAATRALAGRELAELWRMQEAGAVGAATGRAAIADAAVMLRLLRYAAGLGLTVVLHGEEPSLAASAAATEGEWSTRLGLPAAPAETEAIGLARDLALAGIAGAAVHVAALTTAGGIAAVRAARAAGVDVTAATQPAYWLLNDSAVAGYRSFCRLSPPLRSEADRAAVLAALLDGTIDMLCSRHDPRTAEEKRQPFAEAAPGAAGMSTLLPLALGLVRDHGMPLSRLLAMMTVAPAERFGLPVPRLAPGAPADLLLFDPDAPWVIRADELPGLSGNTPFDGLPTQGRVRLLLQGGEPVG